MDGSSLQLNPSKGLVGFLRIWTVSMRDDLRRTGHWLKASAWRWLCELSTSSSLLLVQSGGCICLYHMWPCPSCTVQSVFVTKVIASLRVLSWWWAHVGLRVCSRVISSILRPLEFCTEMCVRKIWKIWRCETVLLCHLWLGLRPEYYVTVPPMMCSPVHCTPSWF